MVLVQNPGALLLNRTTLRRIRLVADQRSHRHPHLVLAVVLLGVSQDSVAESEHVLVGRVLLVRQLLQTQQRTLPSPPVLKGSLQDAKDLKTQPGVCWCCFCDFSLETGVILKSHLFEDVLLPHQLLPLSVGFGHDHIQDRLTAIDDVGYEEHHVLQKLNGKPDRQETVTINSSSSF